LRTKNIHGFTLIELVMLIAIVSILAVFSVAKIGLFSGWDQAGVGQAMNAHLILGQRIALANRRAVYVVADASSIKLCYDAACVVPCKKLDGSNLFLSSAGGTFQGATSFYFDAQGRSSNSSIISITLAGSTVNVEPRTGVIW
jgi:MSHA pilin protein MshC